MEKVERISGSEDGHTEIQREEEGRSPCCTNEHFSEF